MRVGITGHRGLPVEVEERVKRAIRETVSSCPAAGLVGISCIADGPDAWFAQAVLHHGGALEVVVPAEKYRESLPEWHHDVYDDLMRQATQVHETGMTESDSDAHMAGSEILVGLADELIAIWDGQPARGYGGTADVVSYAERTGVPVRVVWPEGASRD
ncbi:hypothetical protein SLUN_19245 [Streptomyces lunaelactis]|uniref:DUF1273 domain-containing protein n=1 Tax=Streptomyces lunaelactis TaxID=1535768 RepID=A0A2R4T4I3_9ACTN|nr:hypothetical protein [Streptomyces lunaelactis]AVZ73984.1 hypothetical protein SLUN_19245 [Streptomyces lunaelactis]NUK89325.1 hypothetical protein [Streptomyces lunaelactis]